MRHFRTKDMDNDSGVISHLRGVPYGAFFRIAELAKCVTGVSDFASGDSRRGWYYTSDWNPCLVAWARGPHKMRQANRQLRAARRWLAEKVAQDPITARMAARQLVRAE